MTATDETLYNIIEIKLNKKMNAVKTQLADMLDNIIHGKPYGKIMSLTMTLNLTWWLER